MENENTELTEAEFKQLTEYLEKNGYEVRSRSGSSNASKATHQDREDDWKNGESDIERPEENRRTSWDSDGFGFDEEESAEWIPTGRGLDTQKESQ